MKIVALFPGQGSQKVGMGKDLSEADPRARAVYARADAVVAADFSTLCFEGPAETLTRTYNAQPALLAHSAAVWAMVRDVVAKQMVAAAGHSLGEFTAYYAAGSLELDEALQLVRERGQLMFDAGQNVPGTMAAILGADLTFVDAVCEQASAAPDGGLVVAANYNSPAQVVISGTRAGVEKAMQLSRDAGAKRTTALEVSGAFHSPLMTPAREGLMAALTRVSFRRPLVPIYANVSAQAISDAALGRELLLEQLDSPVLWTDVVLQLAADFPDALFVEIGNGSVLTKLVQRIAPHVQTAPCGTPQEIAALLERVAS